MFLSFVGLARDCVGGGFPTDGVWLGKFMLGMQKRLGRQIKQDCGLSIEVMLKVQEIGTMRAAILSFSVPFVKWH
jgi:hypothetical protein